MLGGLLQHAGLGGLPTAGGVIFHCGAGRDRTGLVAVLVLASAGVEPAAVADDYDLSTSALPPFFEALGWDDQWPGIAEVLARKGTTAREALLATLRGFDATAYLRGAGVAQQDLDALRSLLGVPATG